MGLPTTDGTPDGTSELTPTLPVQLSFPLPASPDTSINLHITSLSHALTIFLASSTTGAPASMASCGSLIYALPNTRQPSGQPLSTALYKSEGSMDFCTRLAKILAKRVGRPVYIGGDVRFWGSEDEGAALKGVVDVVLKVVGGLETSSG